MANWWTIPKIKISTRAINKALVEVCEKKIVAPGLENLENAAKVGAQKAQERYDEFEYTGSHNAHYSYYQSGKRSFRIEATGNSAMFAEYGTGVFGKDGKAYVNDMTGHNYWFFTNNGNQVMSDAQKTRPYSRSSSKQQTSYQTFEIDKGVTEEDYQDSLKGDPDFAYSKFELSSGPIYGTWEDFEGSELEKKLASRKINWAISKAKNGMTFLEWNVNGKTGRRIARETPKGERLNEYGKSKEKELAERKASYITRGAIPVHPMRHGKHEAIRYFRKQYRSPYDRRGEDD